MAAKRVADNVDRVPFGVDRAAGGTARGAGAPQGGARPSVDGDTEPVIATEAARSAVPVTEVARDTRAEANPPLKPPLEHRIAPEFSDFRTYSACRPGLPHRLQPLPPTPTAVAAPLAAPPTAVAASPTAVAASLAAVAAGANSGCYATYSGRPPDCGEDYVAGDATHPR